jgi:RimJ/RimL family protein N-acetyltransferase
MTCSAACRRRSTEVIATARLVLEPLRSEHAREMAAVLGDPALHAFTGGAPLDAAALQARYERLVAGSPDPDVVWRNWVIRLVQEDRLAGTVQATIAGGVAEVAWVVGTPWQGRGIATEASRALVAHLRGEGIATVVAHNPPEHRASAAVAAAAGLSPTAGLCDGEVRWST